MEICIAVESKTSGAEDLENRLAAEFGNVGEIRLEVRRSRALDGPVLIAIISAVGAGIGALITGLVKIAGQRGESKIVIVGEGGRRLEVPADTPPHRLSEYVELAKQLDVERVEMQ
jgi:hypothetical protein